MGPSAGQGSQKCDPRSTRQPGTHSPETFPRRAAWERVRAAAKGKNNIRNTPTVRVEMLSNRAG